MCYSEALAIEKRPKMRCNWASKSPSYFLPVPSPGIDRFDTRLDRIKDVVDLGLKRGHRSLDGDRAGERVRIESQ